MARKLRAPFFNISKKKKKKLWFSKISKERNPQNAGFEIYSLNIPFAVLFVNMQFICSEREREREKEDAWDSGIRIIPLKHKRDFFLCFFVCFFVELWS